ncbi:hypothetical protein VPH35_007985 [Triticum aestivum]
MEEKGRGAASWIQVHFFIGGSITYYLCALRILVYTCETNMSLISVPKNHLFWILICSAEGDQYRRDIYTNFPRCSIFYCPSLQGNSQEFVCLLVQNAYGPTWFVLMGSEFTPIWSLFKFS